jgi:hypothetical protein
LEYQLKLEAQQYDEAIAAFDIRAIELEVE